MAIVQREKFKAVSLRRAFSMALLIVITAGLVGTFFAKNGRADIPITSPGAQACFDMDVGQLQKVFGSGIMVGPIWPCTLFYVSCAALWH